MSVTLITVFTDTDNYLLKIFSRTASKVPDLLGMSVPNCQGHLFVYGSGQPFAFPSLTEDWKLGFHPEASLSFL